MRRKFKKRLLNELKCAMREYNHNIRLGKELGDGMTAVVFEVIGEKQVLKVMDTRCDTERDTDSELDILARGSMREYFQNECDALRRLAGSPYIMPCYDNYEYIFPEEKRLSARDRLNRSLFFIRMPKLTQLKDYIVAHSSERVLVRMAADICRAFEACAKYNIIHRDVKPANIFVDLSGGDDAARFVLSDFGFCRDIDASENSVVSRVGTPHFIAPEIVGRVPLNSLNSDIYSLGVTLYYLVSGGKFPPDGYVKQIPPLPHISRAFADVILKAIQPYPSNRYQTASQMLRELTSLGGLDSGMLIRDYRFMQAKQEILRGNYEEAILIAEEGCRDGLSDCQRLLAYCWNHEYPNDPKVMRKVRQLLDELVIEGDSVAQFLRAGVHFTDHEESAFIKNLRESAQSGCVLAQYVYGRTLLSGEVVEAGRNSDTGVKYLLMAAEEGYLDAIRVLARSLRENPALRGRVSMSPELEASVSEEIRNQTRTRSDPKNRELGRKKRGKVNKENILRFL